MTFYVFIETCQERSTIIRPYRPLSSSPVSHYLPPIEILLTQRIGGSLLITQPVPEDIQRRI